MKVNHVLGCISKSAASTWRDVFVHLYLVLRRSHLKYCVHFGVPQHKKDIDILESPEEVVRG